MTKDLTLPEKVEKPATHFEEPHHVVDDPTLSVDEKAVALEVLEQDARQLAEASNEGMAGGEPTKLRDVLIAKKHLDTLSVADSYDRVLDDLRDWQKHCPAADTKALLGRAISDLEKIAALRPNSCDSEAG